MTKLPISDFGDGDTYFGNAFTVRRGADRGTL